MLSNPPTNEVYIYINVFINTNIYIHIRMFTLGVSGMFWGSKYTVPPQVVFGCVKGCYRHITRPLGRGSKHVLLSHRNLEFYDQISRMHILYFSS